MNFKNWLLNEMPLSHYSHDFKYSNNEEEGFTSDKMQTINSFTTSWNKFSKKDKILISHPKTMKILEQKLKSSKFNFNILLIETLTRFSVRDYREQVKNYCVENGINIVNSITFAKNATTGHLLTPWMILHTIGHALLEHEKTKILDIENSINKISFEFKERSYDDYESMDDIDGTYLAADWIKDVFMFKSASLKEVPNRMELYHELIAEYLWNGEIRINPNLSNSPYLKHPNSFEILKNQVHVIEQHINDVLASKVGSIITDYT